MRTMGWSLLIAAGTLVADGRETGAQQTAPDSTRSTLAGVYSADQAARGRETYEAMCQSCHLPVTHTGPAFTQAWQGRPLWELFRYIRELMPKNEPGTLTLRETTQVLAYLLQMNGMPAGSTELPGNTTVLKTIRIDLKATQDSLHR